LLIALRKADTIFRFEANKDLKLSKAEKQNIVDIEKYEKNKWFVEVAKLSYSHAFGELALIHEEPRAATVQCISDCYFAVLGK
jgi:hypothetical protein